MPRSRDYIEGFKDALKAYSWVGNDKLIRVGLPGILLNTVIAKIENEMEAEMAPMPIEPVPKESEKEEPPKEEK